MTAEQRRADEKSEYDAFLAGCPTRQVMEVIGAKWPSLLLIALAGGSMRHGELRRRVAGISQKMLTPTCANSSVTGWSAVA